MIPISSDGNNCLFRAVSHCLYGTEDRHIEIRSVVVGNITEKWRANRNCEESYERSNSIVTDYKRVHGCTVNVVWKKVNF